jgi:nitrilase
VTPVTVTIVQQPSAALDLAESVQRAAAYVAQAAGEGADLVVFPETWLTCYPAWVFGLAGWRDPLARHWHAKLLDNSAVLDHDGGVDDDLAPIRAAARSAGVTVALGLNERSARGSGTVYNSLILIGPDGSTLNLHRKLTPTHTERIVWGAGDGAGLRVVDTPSGRVGGLICWEHFHPLARHALHAQQESIHIAAWPDMTEQHLIAARSYALEGRCHVICAAQIVSAADIPVDLRELFRAGVGPDAPVDGLLFDGGSCVVAPDGSWVVEPRYGEKGLITARIDTEARYGEMLDLDIAGHYSRSDVFTLSVQRRRPGSGVQFTDVGDMTADTDRDQRGSGAGV